MTQVISVIKDALGHLRVIDAASSPDANDVADAIESLNRMVRAWEAEGLSIGWSDVAAGTDVLPTPPELDEALGYNLATRLRSKYGVTADQDVYQMAASGLAMIRAQVANSLFERIEYPDLPRGQGQRCGYGWRDGFNC